MARFVMANRRAGKFHETEQRAARQQAHAAFAMLENVSDVVGKRASQVDTDREVVVFDADPGDVAQAQAQAGADVMIEPEILHHTALVKPLDIARSLSDEPPAGSVGGDGATLALTVVGDGAPVANAEVILIIRFRGITDRLTVMTDDKGKVAFSFSSSFTPVAAITVPADAFWSTVTRGPADGDRIELPRLPVVAPVGWWHQVLGIDGSESRPGAGIKVGVIDTGIGPNADLSHATNVGAFIGGAELPDEDFGLDVDTHGTHVNGTIGARPRATTKRPMGIAAGVDLFSARVFPPGGGANQGDIANAIDHLSAVRGVDLINMSLGAPVGSEIERDAIQDALERGTLCVVAAGNSDGPVQFPAAFAETVAVSALGLEGWGPPGTLASIRIPTEPDRFGDDGLYLANFSCFGAEIDVAGPGVGIIASLPERFGLKTPLGSMDGTSMASPAALAALAAVLSQDQTYRALPRDLVRATRARALLGQSARDIGLAARFQGQGVPCADPRGCSD